MLAVVRKHHTDKTLFEVKGEIPPKVMIYLRNEFGRDVRLIEEEEKMLDITSTGWFKEISAATSPGDALKIYRENAGLTQEKLAQKLGKFTRQKISDMERGKRSISKDTAKKLSEIFDVPVVRFL